MKMLKNMVLAIAILFAVPLTVALFTTKEYRVEREITINRPNVEVFNYLKLLKNQPDYAKWAKGDAAMRISSRGSDGTVGFISDWESNNKDIGKGEQEITKIMEGSEIDVNIRFTKPSLEIQNNYFSTEAITPNQTKVKWAMAGRMAYPMNFMMLFVNVDNVMGSGLATDLANLKATLEK